METHRHTHSEKTSSQQKPSPQPDAEEQIHEEIPDAGIQRSLATPPPNLKPGDLLLLQRTVGNRAVQQRTGGGTPRLIQRWEPCADYPATEDIPLTPEAVGLPSAARTKRDEGEMMGCLAGQSEQMLAMAAH